jgi:hypothetical protein
MAGLREGPRFRVECVRLLIQLQCGQAWLCSPANRTDFIRTAIRNQLDRHTDAVKQSVARKKLDLGLRHYTREELEAVEAAGETLDIQVLGLASIAPDVTPELARRTIAAIHVLGALHASPAVKAVLSDRMR